MLETSYTTLGENGEMNINWSPSYMYVPVSRNLNKQWYRLVVLAVLRDT